MPKSRIRKKESYTPKAVASAKPVPTESPRWLAPLMIATFLIGLLWIVVFYITSTAYPIPGIGAWNMVVGFGFITVGFGLSTKWR
jgi:hypothetical protein